jgi:cytochrome b
MTGPVPESRTRVRVWDLPTRLGHWSMVVLIALSWWTAKSGRMEWHRWSGYLLLGLVLFRLWWGFVGSSTARFAGFVRGPRAILAYLRGTAPAVPGHNPVGALNVLVLLGLLGVQIVLGLFAVDVDGIESGPLSEYVSFDAGRVAAHWHETVFNALLVFVALHVLAVAYYVLFRREDLVRAMLRGWREQAPGTPSLVPGGAVRFIIGVLLAVAFTWFVAHAFRAR